jgi:hypothetical protein
MAKIVVYNFNENNSTTARDYSENGNDGTISGVAIQSSSRVGYDAVFNGNDDYISLGNITDLNGALNWAIHFGIQIDSDADTKYILRKEDQIVIDYNYSTNVLTATVTNNLAATISVSATLTLSTFYDIDVDFSGGTLTLYVDGTQQDQSSSYGVTSTNSNVMFLGADNDSDNLEQSANFTLNEFQIFDSNLTDDNRSALINEQNGILSDSGIDAQFNVGDIIGANLFSTPIYGVITFVSGSAFRFIPISTGILIGQSFSRVGHLWDTARQWGLKIDVDGTICFYDGQSTSSEVFAASKKTYCFTKDGPVLNSSTVTTNYTVVDSDQRIYVDSTSGVITITLMASPATDKEIEIIDKTGQCGINTVTINGNGNNIIGDSTYLMTTPFEAVRLIFNGMNWNLN